MILSNNASVKSNIRFYCPYQNCIYIKDSERYFRNEKQLKQHICKVHAEKKFLCEKCRKGFGSECQQRYHERTCGVEWKCSCGCKYNLRETLLTHHRRTGHPVPQGVIKRERSKAGATQNSKNLSSRQPTVVIMPVTQTIVYTNQNPLNCMTLLPEKIFQDHFGQGRLILPKSCTNLTPVVTNLSTNVVLQESNNEQIKLVATTHATAETQTTSTEAMQTQTEEPIYVLPPVKIVEKSLNMRKIPKTVAATQTGRLPLESRASQCSPRTPTGVRNRRRGYRGTSIETQTVESIVGRIKSSSHSKSRSSTKTMKKNSEAQSVWSCLNKLLKSTLSRSSSGTQTSPRGKVNHITCASQTLTGKGLEPSSEQTAHEMLGLLATVCQHFKDNSMTKESALSSLQRIISSKIDKPDPVDKVESLGTITSLLQSEGLSKLLTERCSSEPPEELSVATTHDLVTSVPLSLNIETQTSTMNCPDYFSSNMETQTTEDTLLSDLELSHIQTQTPWDFLDFCDDLNPNQLSADIQTDITGEDFTDIFEDVLWNTNTGTSLADVTDMETQTHGQLTNMELINSCTQTLDDSLQLDLVVAMPSSILK